MTETTARLRMSCDLSRRAPRDASRSSSLREASRLAPPAHAVTGGVQEDAAVEVEHLALHPARLPRAEESHQVGHLLRFADRAQRRRALELLVEGPLRCLAAEVVLDRVGRHVAGVDGVDCDAARTELDREVARERLERRLRRGEDAVPG